MYIVRILSKLNVMSRQLHYLFLAIFLCWQGVIGAQPNCTDITAGIDE